ncbi:hypothetical protein D8666_15455 [Ochrobactrum soli]|uniref:Uncharacterized protein n=1 Tax=Ochrobactrum teleogrylli TaxID=2479765 RepID=A0ABY2Y032_9HYPH|nr:hypothetical protein D8666_15455 [[Ochrobactrum] soli]RRD24299.1 hypothetical protein ECB98_14475 [Brucellaceae bacterium VT-16-1752]TNV10411.1 hypothetical protein FIC94_20185 [[Ochrobactrum] teleogrylli]
MNMTVMRAISMAVFVIFMRRDLQFSESLSQTGFCVPPIPAYMMGIKSLRFNNRTSADDR